MQLTVGGGPAALRDAVILAAPKSYIVIRILFAIKNRTLWVSGHQGKGFQWHEPQLVLAI
jgi:hypothetical protein